MSLVETEDWKLAAFIEWRPKSKRIDCPHCGGTGRRPWRMCDLDEDNECKACNGTGASYKMPTGQPPEIPEALREHMRRAWWDFIHAQPKDRS